jgi:hypothetical protein
MLADAETFYKDANGHFSMEKWKARIDRYRNIDFSPYINDGTIIAHFMIDEPQDPTNWNGVPLTGAQMEEMAKYSKQLWPRMATLVRAPPSRIKWSGTYRYLDAAWAQVENVRGGLNIQEFLEQNVSSARSQGLALAVGLNVTKGGLNKGKMTAGQIKSYGAVLLSSSYPCAFISWMYDAPYLAQPDIREAVASLSEKARNRPGNSCHTKSQAPVPGDGNTPGDDDGAEPGNGNGSGNGNGGGVPGTVSPTPGSVTGMALRLSGWRKAKRPYVVLNWSGAAGTRVDIYRDGRVVYAGAVNDRRLVDTKGLKRRTSYTYKVCQRGTSKCSNQAVAALQ